jgi:hypothetical protein
MTDSEVQRREVIRLILSLEQTGQVLSDEVVRAKEPELHEKACQLFGTWPVALEYAGVRLVRGSSQNATPDLIIRRIRRRCADLHSMRAVNIRRADFGLYRQAIAMFGSWQKALAEAGIDKDLLYSGPKNPKLTREAALDLLTQRIRNGGVPTLAILACENQYLARCLIARCGSFQAALNLAAADAASESVEPVS